MERRVMVRIFTLKHVYLLFDMFKLTLPSHLQETCVSAFNGLIFLFASTSAYYIYFL